MRQSSGLSIEHAIISPAAYCSCRYADVGVFGFSVAGAWADGADTCFVFSCAGTVVVTSLRSGVGVMPIFGLGGVDAGFGFGFGGSAGGAGGFAGAGGGVGSGGFTGGATGGFGAGDGAGGLGGSTFFGGSGAGAGLLALFFTVNLIASRAALVRK